MSFFDDVRTNGAGRRPGNTGVSGYNGGTTPPAVVAGPPPAANTATAPASSGSSLASRYPSIVKAYQEYLGRTPSDAEILGQTGNGSFGPSDPRVLMSATNIQRSPEAQAYAKAKPATTPDEPFTRTAENNPGLDPAKWLAGHTSPKYAFHEVAKKYDQRTEAGRQQTLKELQTLHPKWFNGWTIAGDKLRYSGDPSQLDGKWNGYNEFDAWQGSKDGVWRPQWIPTQLNGQAYVDPASQQAASASSAGGGVPAASPMTLPSSQSPSQSAAPLNQGAGGGNQTTRNGGYGVDSGQGFGALMAPWEWEFDYGDFKAPTEADMLADPGYKFRRDQGQKAIERSASAEGSLLGGGTLRALMDFGQGLGSQEYGNVYNRKFGEFADARKSAFDEFSTAYNVFNRNQDVPFNRLAAIAGLGQSSAGQLGNQGQAFAGNYGATAMNGANAQAGYWGDAANAGAAGRVGSANAWNSALTNTANNASQSYYNWQWMNRPRTPTTGASPFTFGTPVPGYGGG